MTHRATAEFWSCYGSLPVKAKETADRMFALLKNNPRHPSLRFKKVGVYWSVRAGLGNRAVGRESPTGIIWFWIGPHDDYERLIRAHLTVRP